MEARAMMQKRRRKPLSRRERGRGEGSAEV
jgi:hypothetical protein